MDEATTTMRNAGAIVAVRAEMIAIAAIRWVSGRRCTPGPAAPPIDPNGVRPEAPNSCDSTTGIAAKVTRPAQSP
ncbi:unannotated protein [freshwater metagenome]|uniref:Unannotated protein n=1 Tax=freshwater metagenome TaxID=449393 RepID=A0A6J5YH74_9ZZZZ